MSTIRTDKQYEAEDAARTLMRAEEIKRNKSLYKSALAEIRKREQEASKVLKIHGSNMN